MNNSPSNLVSYTVHAQKKKLILRETIGDLFFGFTIYCRKYFGLTFTIGHALNVENPVASLYNFNTIKYSFSIFLFIFYSLSLIWTTLPLFLLLLLLFLHSHIQTTLPLFSSSSSSSLLLHCLSHPHSQHLSPLLVQPPPTDQTHHKTHPSMSLTMSNIGGLSRSNDG